MTHFQVTATGSGKNAVDLFGLRGLAAVVVFVYLVEKLNNTSMASACGKELRMCNHYSPPSHFM